jgi:membrane protein YdbS with pleckstrin-like domain
MDYILILDNYFELWIDYNLKINKYFRLRNYSITYIAPIITLIILIVMLITIFLVESFYIPSIIFIIMALICFILSLWSYFDYKRLEYEIKLDKLNILK